MVNPSPLNWPCWSLAQNFDMKKIEEAEKVRTKCCRKMLQFVWCSCFDFPKRAITFQIIYPLNIQIRRNGDVTKEALWNDNFTETLSLLWRNWDPLDMKSNEMESGIFSFHKVKVLIYRVPTPQPKKTSQKCFKLLSLIPLRHESIFWSLRYVPPVEATSFKTHFQNSQFKLELCSH